MNRDALPFGEGGKKQNSCRKNVAIDPFITDDYCVFMKRVESIETEKLAPRIYRPPA
jgi:hypothetical protein